MFVQWRTLNLGQLFSVRYMGYMYDEDVPILESCNKEDSMWIANFVYFNDVYAVENVS